MKYYYCLYDNRTSNTIVYEIDASSERIAQTTLLEEIIYTNDLPEQWIELDFKKVLDKLADEDIMVSRATFEKL